MGVEPFFRNASTKTVSLHKKDFMHVIRFLIACDAFDNLKLSAESAQTLAKARSEMEDIEKWTLKNLRKSYPLLSGVDGLFPLITPNEKNNGYEKIELIVDFGDQINAMGLKQVENHLDADTIAQMITNKYGVPDSVRYTHNLNSSLCQCMNCRYLRGKK
jgi:hypothetical protein